MISVCPDSVMSTALCTGWLKNNRNSSHLLLLLIVVCQSIWNPVLYWHSMSVCPWFPNLSVRLSVAKASVSLSLIFIKGFPVHYIWNNTIEKQSYRPMFKYVKFITNISNTILTSVILKHQVAIGTAALGWVSLFQD